MLKVNLDYVTSKLDYKKKDQIIDLYTLRIRRTQEESKEHALKLGLADILNPTEGLEMSLVDGL